MILITLKIQIAAGQEATWLEHIAAYTAAVRAEPGTVSFDCYRSLDDQLAFSIIESFESPEAGDVHVKTDHFTAFLEWFPTVIDGAPSIVNTQVDGWSRMSEFE